MNETKPVNSRNFTPPGCGLWSGWLLVNVIASAFGWRLGWLASGYVPGKFSIFTIGLVYGTVLSFGQWLIIRTELRNSLGWVVASIIGYTIGLSAGAFAATNLSFTGFRFGLVAGAIFGTVAGILQGIILSRQVSRAYIWLPASIFAWTTAFFYYSPISFWVGGFYGVVSSLITGTALMWLLYRPIQ
jgi:hypothetical protein